MPCAFLQTPGGQWPNRRKPIPVIPTQNIFTALRQPEAALETALAMTVNQQERLSSARGFGVDEALALVPGVLTQSRTGNQDVRVMIRGFGARGIRVYVDSFPETESDGRTSFDLVEIANAHSIEVLRTNASTLWGNVAGGVINIRTTPVSETPFLEMRTVGKYFADDANTLPVASATVFDAAIGFEKPLHQNVGLKGFFRVNNLADKKFIASIWINPDRPAGGDPAFIEPGLLRNFAGGLPLIWNL